MDASVAREQRLWSWFRDGVKAIPRLHLQRIENGAGLGTPDLEACWEGRQFWVELKGSDRPAKSSTPIRYKLTLEQVLWAEERWRAGGSVYLYLRIGFGKAVRRFIIPGSMARQALEAQTEAWWERHTIIDPLHTPREALEVLAKARGHEPLQDGQEDQEARKAGA